MLIADWKRFPTEVPGSTGNYFVTRMGAENQRSVDICFFNGTFFINKQNRTVADVVAWDDLCPVYRPS